MGDKQRKMINGHMIWQTNHSLEFQKSKVFIAESHIGHKERKLENQEDALINVAWEKITDSVYISPGPI